MGEIPSGPGQLLEKLLPEPLTRSQRAEALRILAEVALVEENPAEADDLLVQALSFADDARAQARIQLVLAYVAHFSFDFVRTAECAHRAVELLADCEDGPLLAEALSYRAIADFIVGRGVEWKKWNARSSSRIRIARRCPGSARPVSRGPADVRRAPRRGA